MLHLTVEQRKREGAHYTPSPLAEFVAERICKSAECLGGTTGILKVLDPAVGDGELLRALLCNIRERDSRPISVSAFDTDACALESAESRITELALANVQSDWQATDFLDFVLQRCHAEIGPLFRGKAELGQYDLVIANPPYVRTQVLGQKKSRQVAAEFGLEGRVDLYYAFLLAISDVLKPGGLAGVIVSNRFLTTRAGASIRAGLLERYEIIHLWDLGDTKLFKAAVLPAVLLLKKPGSRVVKRPTAFTSIYCTKESRLPSESEVQRIFETLENERAPAVFGDPTYSIRQGVLDIGDMAGDVWRISDASTDAWLKQVDLRTKMRFADIGKVRVGVKTTADRVYIRNDWDSMASDERPELLRPLITHHYARRFKALDSVSPWQILYTHCTKKGERVPVDLAEYPRAKRYLEQHRGRLEGRTYVREAGREWFEIWVPHRPDMWRFPKLVFRDISDKPVFWIDLSGAVVNGDCYWISGQEPERERLLWLALGIGNSEFIEEYYDRRFNNKLYAGRRRFMTQYVEQFPLPDPDGERAINVMTIAKSIYDGMETDDTAGLQRDLNAAVYAAFAL